MAFFSISGYMYIIYIPHLIRIHIYIWFTIYLMHPSVLLKKKTTQQRIFGPSEDGTTSVSCSVQPIHLAVHAGNLRGWGFSRVTTRVAGEGPWGGEFLVWHPWGMAGRKYEFFFGESLNVWRKYITCRRLKLKLRLWFIVACCRMV